MAEPGRPAAVGAGSLPSPMLTLGLDTSGDVCAVALLDGDAVAFQADLAVPRSHGRRLVPLVAQAFAHVGRTPADLGLVAVAAGPGSYTGLRIGMGTAKGLALATGCAFAAVPTLQALASTAGGGASPAARAVAAVLPSRRGEVYAAAYRDGAEVRPASALAVGDVAGWLPEGAAVGGPGAGLVGPAVPRVEMRASGVAVARLGLARWQATGGDDPAAAEPAYLKPVAAVRPRGIFG